MSRKVRITFAIFAAIVLAAGIFVWFTLFRVIPQPPFENAESQFKYGSLQGENEQGISYWVWLVLPRIFPDLLPGPGGYKSLGIPWELGEELPVGLSKRTVGYPRVAANCAFCHTSTYRTNESENPQFVVSGPAHTSNIQGYVRFFTDAANDKRFNADVILAEMDYVYRLSVVDKLLYRYWIIPSTRRTLLGMRERLSGIHEKADWGAGRTDMIGLTRLMFRTKLSDRSGMADIPSIWNLRVRDGHPLNWDGTATLRSIMIDSALVLGAPGRSVLKTAEQLETWLKGLPPPRYPFAINEQKATEGRAIYNEYCESCHEPGQPRTGTVIDIADIGTDRERLDSWTQADAESLNTAIQREGLTHPSVVKTNGYVAPPLDGLWLRAPFLHNGSVPNLHELLEPEEKRTPVFYRGYDVYDPNTVGFATQGPQAERFGLRFDVSGKGNGNRGHRYGTDLSQDMKDALIEYLKTQ